MHFSYERFLENRLREAFGFEGTPIRIQTRGRADKRVGGRRVGKSGPSGKAAKAEARKTGRPQRKPGTHDRRK